MNFRHENIDASYQSLMLYDLVAKTTTDITMDGTEYKFSAESTPQPVNRFKIFAKKANKTQNSPKYTLFNLGNILNVAYEGTNQANINIFDISGRKIAQRKIQPNTIEDFELQKQKVYIVKINTNDETLTQKILMR